MVNGDEDESLINFATMASDDAVNNSAAHLPSSEAGEAVLTPIIRILMAFRRCVAGEAIDGN